MQSDSAPQIPVEPPSAVPAALSETKMTAISTMADKQSLAADAAQQPDRWSDLIKQLRLSGVLLMFARNCCLDQQDGSNLNLTLDARQELLFKKEHINKLEQALADLWQSRVKLQVTVGKPAKATPHELLLQHRQQVEANLMADPFVQVMVQRFGASLDKDSLQIENS